VCFTEFTFFFFELSFLRLITVHLHGIHTIMSSRGCFCPTGLQYNEPSRKLSNEILFLPLFALASTFVYCRNRYFKHGWICFSKNVTIFNHFSFVFTYNFFRNEEGEPETHGHITSLAVSRTYRKLGLARHLMNATR
jgi:GNAT superfamily N-acetyltransferase